tara:strand:- start:2562 stop:4814 length:2253 start_codon:yes stop_codon:yes gene_type:complete
VTEKKPLSKRLAEKKKEHHVPIISGERADPSRYPVSLLKGRRSERLSRNTIAGRISPTVADLPLSAPSDPTCAEGTTTSIADSAVRALEASPKSLEKEDLYSGHASQPLFQSFAPAESTFTFDSRTDVAPFKTARPEPDIPAEAIFRAPPVEPTKRLLLPATTQARTIFDVLQDHADTVSHDATGVPLPKTMVEMHIASEDHSIVESVDLDKISVRPSVQFLDVQTLSKLPPTKPLRGAACSERLPQLLSTNAPGFSPVWRLLAGEHANQIFMKLLRWVQKEAIQLQRLEMDCAARVMITEPISGPVQSQSLVLCQTFFPHSSTAPAVKVPKIEKSLDAWASQRIFFADVGGHTRLVDLNRTLYDINVTIDDGASDFDSVGSPMKIYPAPAPLPPFYDSEISHSEEDTEADLGLGFGNCQESDCMFAMDPTHDRTSDSTPASTLSHASDEHITDPSLIFSPPKTTAMVGEEGQISAGASRVIGPFPGHDEQSGTRTRELDEPKVQEICLFETEATEHDQVAPQFDPVVEIDGNTSIEAVPKHPHIDGSSILEDKGEVTEAILMDTSLFLQTETAYIPFPHSSIRHVAPGLRSTDADSAPISENTIPYEAFSSDWASDLKRLTLGTESIFTYLDLLETGDDELATKTAIVATFLQLVNKERDKLGRRGLPTSYSASSVMSSQIMPHTIFLGTVSLAAFLSHFEFSSDGKTTIDQVYHVFKSLRFEHLHIQAKATTGIMGALGRRLGKLAEI